MAAVSTKDMRQSDGGKAKEAAKAEFNLRFLSASCVTSVNAFISKLLGTHLYMKVFFQRVVELSLNYRVFVKYLGPYLSIINTGYQPRKYFLPNRS